MRRELNSRDTFTMLFSDYLEDNRTTLISLLTTKLSGFTSIIPSMLVDMMGSLFPLQDINVRNDFKKLDSTKKAIVISQYTTEIALWALAKAPYYNELISNYNKAYDYATGNKKVVSRSDSYRKAGSTANNGSTSGDHTEYDLPNKNVDPSTYRNNPSELSTDSATNNNTTTVDHTTTGSSTVTTTYDNELLDLKRKYLAQIRNIYEEYANEFKEFFYLIYPSGYTCEEDNL